MLVEQSPTLFSRNTTLFCVFINKTWLGLAWLGLAKSLGLGSAAQIAWVRLGLGLYALAWFEALSHGTVPIFGINVLCTCPLSTHLLDLAWIVDWAGLESNCLLSINSTN